jgi:type VII secretion protein EccE
MHFGLKPPTVGQALATVATVTALQYALTAAAHLADTRYLTITPTTIILAALTITYRDRTLAGWFVHRRACTRRTPRLTQVLSHDTTAILWDHTTGHASILIEITPKPFSVNIINQNETWSSQTLDLDPIRHELRQYDIRLHDLTLTTVGYTYAHQNHLAKIAFNTTGPINAIAYGRTYLRVTLDTTTSATSIHAREIDNYANPRETLASGIARTLQIASSRTHRAITLQGFTAHKLSKTEATQLHHELVALLGADALAEESFTHAGHHGPYLVAFTPTAKTTDRTHPEWLRATTEVCASITRMTPSSDTTDQIEQFYCNRVHRLETVELAEATDLRREYGQHTAIATTALPLAVAPAVTAIPKTTLTADAPTHTHAVPGGVGIYLGYTLDGLQRIWLDITVASTEPLWIIGPRHAVELLLIRSATLGLRIDVRTPALAAIAHELRHAGVGTHTRPDITVAAIGDDHRTPAPVRIVWSEYPIVQRPRYFIDATTPGVLHVHTATDDVKVQWEFTAAEKALLTHRPVQNHRNTVRLPRSEHRIEPDRRRTSQAPARR